MKSLDIITIQSVSQVIDTQYQSHTHGREYRLTTFFARAGISLTPEWYQHFAHKEAAVFNLMSALNGTDEIDKVLLRLTTPKEYGGNHFGHQNVVKWLNDILVSEDLEIVLKGSTPFIKDIVVPDLEGSKIELIAEEPPIRQAGKGVFVVHGRDTGAKDTVVRFLQNLKLAPVVLQELPDQGRTIIEKFEDYANTAGFAIVLFTPDDEGSLVEGINGLQPRARQNVIFELGYFIGKLGRNRACALVKGEVEMLSDYAGVLYIPFDNDDGWQFRLIKELQSAGFDVDANLATR